jgi:hypothetical protein
VSIAKAATATRNATSRALPWFESYADQAKS